MSQSQLDVFQKAASRIAQRSPADTVSTTDRVTVQCNLFYNETRQAILRRHPWNFAKKNDDLIPYFAESDLTDAPTLEPAADVNSYPSWESGTHTLSHDGTETWTYYIGGVSQQTATSTSKIPPTSSDDWSGGLALDFPSDNEDWGHAYRVPSDSVRIREVLPAGTVGTTPVYTADQLEYLPVIVNDENKTLFDVQGEVLYTITGSARVNYTWDVTDLTKWDASAYQYLWTEMAYNIAMPVTSKMALKNDVAAELAVIRKQAPATNVNEKHRKLRRSSSLVNARLK